MNQLLFTYEDTEIRTLEQDGEPWFIVKDLCDILDIVNPSQAMARLDDNEKSTIIINEKTPNGGNPRVGIVNESGMYSLVLSSRKPEAKAFKRWITSEVIPSIRKTGMYNVSTLSPAEILLKMAEQNLNNEKMLLSHDHRITVLETEVRAQNSYSVPTLADVSRGSVLQISHVVPVDSKSSVKDFFANIGIAISKGVSRGIGRSVTKLCRDNGVSVEFRLASLKGKTKIAHYPKDMLREVGYKRGLI
jgi:prophage antirepressor-like protein